MLVAIASYPKSGNTWTRALLSAAFNTQQASFKFEHLHNRSIHSANRKLFEDKTGLDIDYLTNDEIYERRDEVYKTFLSELNGEKFFFKTHDLNQIFSNGNKLFDRPSVSGAIYLIRHPFDVVVSYAAHSGQSADQMASFMTDQGAMLSQYVPSLAASGCRPMDQLPQHLSSWDRHVISWTEASSFPVVVARYEDMLSDTGKVLARINQTFGLGLDSERIDEAVEATSFERMQALERSTGFNERPQTLERFFREGRSGAGAALPEDLRRRLWEHVGPVAERFGYQCWA